MNAREDWIDPETGRASRPACEGYGYHEDGSDEGEPCAVCDGRGRRPGGCRRALAYARRAPRLAEDPQQAEERLDELERLLEDLMARLEEHRP